MIIRYHERKQGPTLADDAKAVVDDFVEDAVSDVRETPEQFAGTPYKKTGALVRDLSFKKAVGGSKTAGIIGTIVAPLSRFAAKHIRDGFVTRIESLWAGRGVGWSRSRKGRG